MSNFYKKIALWHKDVLTLIVLNVLVLTSVPAVSDFAGIILFVILPGMLISRLIDLHPKDIWEYLLHVISLSISYLMLGGLLINTFLPFFGVHQPLSLVPVITALNTSLLCFMLASYLHRAKDSMYEFLSSFKFQHYIYPILFAVLPIMAIAGSTILSNGGTNTVTLLTLAIIALFFITAAGFSFTWDDSILVSGLYFSGLSLLLMMSMRSPHVVGFDINHELQVFRLTHQSFLWAMTHMQDTYSACLSITILPTIFSNFIHLPDEYIYKLFFQLIFALFPVGLFYFVRNISNRQYAFLASILLIGQEVFVHEMPALIRQEFGFLYFVLILLVLFSKHISARTRYILLGIYGVSLVVSHYSTTYVAILLLASTFLFNTVLSFLKRLFPSLFRGHISHVIPWQFIVFLIVCTITWLTIITGASSSMQSFVAYSSSNVSETFSYNTLHDAFFQVFSPRSQSQSFEAYISNQVTHFRQIHPELSFYGAGIQNTTNLGQLNFPQQPPHFGFTIKRWAELAFQALKIVINNVSIIFGMLALIYLWYTNKFSSSEFLLLAISGFLTLAIFLVLPNALNQYNIERLYFQLLIVWSTLSVVCFVSVLSFTKRQFQVFATAVMYCVLFLFYTSAIFLYTGGSVLVSLSNYGVDYEKFYPHEGEIYAAQWLGAHQENNLIFSNTPGLNRLEAYGNIDPKNIVTTTFPTIIDKNSYVFTTYINTVSGISTYLYNGEEFAFVAPTQFLNENKDLIYTSGVAQVFH